MCRCVRAPCCHRQEKQGTGTVADSYFGAIKDPTECGRFDVLDRAPGAATADQFGLEQADHRLGQSVVQRVVDRVGRGVDAGFGQSFGEGDRRVLRPVVGMMRQAGEVGDAFSLSGPIACSIVPSTKSVRMLVEARQPRMRRALASITNAT